MAKVRNLDHFGPRPPRRRASALDLCLAGNTHRMVLFTTTRDSFSYVVTEIWRCPVCGTEDVVPLFPDDD